jgi:hypothetical protein
VPGTWLALSETLHLAKSFYKESNLEYYQHLIGEVVMSSQIGKETGICDRILLNLPDTDSLNMSPS